MVSLNEINLQDVQENVNYVVSIVEYERFGDSESHLLFGNGKEVLEFIKERVGFDEEDIEDLFSWFNDNNGDGDDLVSIFEV